MNAIELEVRDCECGCGRSFRCLPTSSQKFASSACGDPSGTLRVWGRGRKVDPQKEEARKALNIPDEKDEEASTEGLLTMVELALKIGKSRATIALWTKSGKIPCKRPGKGRRPSLYDLEEVKAALHDAKPLPPMAPPEEVEERPAAMGAAPILVEAERKTVQLVQNSPAEEPKAANAGAKPKLARAFLKAARDCHARKERQAERVLLWLAVEALGLLEDEKPKSLEEIKADQIKEALARNDGNRTRAAKDLGICVRTMRNSVARYGIGDRDQ
jgi:predicted DNA-binding transcriptional regulator AlpA